MDQTIKPLLIPPEFALYAEKHSIFELYQVKNSSLLSTNFEFNRKYNQTLLIYSDFCPN